MPSRLSVKVRWEIVSLSEARQLSSRAIGRQLKVDRRAVADVIKRYQETGDIADLPRTGRPRTTTPQQDKSLIRFVRRHPEKSSIKVAANLKEKTGVNLSASIVRRRLVAAGLKAHPYTSKPALTKKHKDDRLQFAKRSLRRQWSNVLFSDEAKIYLGTRKKLGRRRIGEKLYKRKFKHPGSLNIWGCFGRGGFGKIHIFRENLTGKLYREILDEHLLPSAARVVPASWVFQDDNDPKHRSHVVEAWLTEHKIKHLDWPANSPDLNPIENVWRPLKDNIAARQPKNLDQLEKFIKQEWKKLTLAYAISLVDSMPKRLQAVLDNNGDVINY